ncbi:uncharacterized protein ACRADG_005509 [Cochliomyia hominivorax]
MTLLSPFLIFGLLQLLSHTAGNPVTTISPKVSFLEFYDQEFSLIAENFCEKAKNLSEKLLKDKEIKESSSVQLKEYKIFLEHLLQDYPHIKRFNLYQPLLAVIINTISTETINKFDRDYEDHIKFKEIFKQKFTEILQEYEQNYKKFILDKFVPKTEELKQKLKEEDLQNMPKFQEMVEKLKNCQDFNCFPLYLDPMFSAMNISQEIYIKYSKKDLKKAIGLIAIRINDYGLSLLNSEKFLQLSKETQKHLIEDVNDFNSKFINNNDIDKFIQSLEGKPYFPHKYENNDNLPLDDREILNELLSKLKTASNNDKYELGNVNVINNLTFKMIFTFWLIPEDDLKPYYEFLGIPFKN